MWLGSNCYIKNIRIIVMDDNLKGIAVLATVLHRLDNGKGLNRENYSTLDTEFTDPETWWNTLTETQKINVGGIAIHFNKMSANYRWDCYNTKYCDLKKSQKQIIKFVLTQKDKDYSMFPLQSMLKFK
jgi:hypothetical protein